MTVSFTLGDTTKFVNSVPRRHNQRSSIQHWQLCDMVAFPNKDKREVVVVFQTGVTLYNLQKNASLQLFNDLGYSPTAMSAGLGYLAVGGQRGQITIRRLDSDWTEQASVGGAINNAVSISAHLGEPRLMICNNDESIKIIELPSMSMLANLKFPVAMNHAMVSPDGKRMIAVGDWNQAFMFDVQVGYKQMATFKTMNDSGFSCAWNQASDKFAIACQDGFVCVWDVRSSKRLVELKSTQTAQKGACRCVKFSPSGSIDLLAFTEHVSYVNVVDARTFTNRQSIRVGPENVDTHVTGLAFAPDSQSMFVGLEQQLLEFDIDTMQRRTFANGSILGFPNQIVMVRTRALLRLMTSYRRFEAGDLFRINQINLDYYTENYSASFYLHYLLRWPEYFYIAESVDGRPIGYIMGKSEGIDKNWHGHVTALTVAPGFRRMGVANQLMRRLEETSEQGRMYFVDLFVRASNKAAIGMYEKMGYTVYRRVINYYSGPLEDALDMRKALARDINKESIVPLPEAVWPDDLDF